MIAHILSYAFVECHTTISSIRFRSIRRRRSTPYHKPICRHSRAYPVIRVAIHPVIRVAIHPVIPIAYPVIRVAIPSFALPSIPSFLRAYHVVRVAIPSFPRLSCHSWAYRVIPAPITSFPRRRESCGLFPKRIHRSTCATMNQTERPLLSSLLHCGEAGGHDAVYVDMMLSIEVEVVA